jgi:beta-lactamase regulating signal transducer with metallopeptidase domain
MFAALINHLWQSTIFAVGVGVLTLVLRRNSASVRHRLWFCASVKFLLPFALLSVLGSHIHRQQVNLVANTAGAQVASMAIERIVAPMPASDQVIGAPPPGAAPMHPWLKVLGMVWACGVLGIAGYWLALWARIRRVLIASTPIAMDFPIPVRTTRQMQEPAVAGIVRPVLLLPAGIEEWLSTEQLRAVLAHESCHVTRRDNLKAALHMVVEALFWFHPLVWWLETRLIAERERACDEEVLAAGNSAPAYAEGIVRVCQNYLDSPLRCAAGVGGGDLAKRIDCILNSPRRMRLSALQAILLGSIASAVVAAPIVSGHLEAPMSAAASAGSGAAKNGGQDGATEVDPRWQAVARLPQAVWQRLKDSDEPGEQEMFQRNSQLTRPGSADAWGSAMQERIRQFFATRPEAAAAQIAVACREVQCQVQVVLPLPGVSGEEAPSELIIDALRRQPWYQNELAMIVGQVGMSDGKSYHLQYFDRKSTPFEYSVPQVPFATMTSAVTPFFPTDIYQLMVDQWQGYPTESRQLAALAHAHGKVAGAQDDPEWARPIERRLREAISADPAAQPMDVRSIACRKTGCELQWFDNNPSVKPTDLPPWIQVVEHIRKSELGAAIEMDANFGSKYGASVMYVTTFKRKPDSGVALR